MKRALLAVQLIAIVLCLTATAGAQCPPSCGLPGGGAAEQDCHAEFAAAGVRLNYPPFDPNNPMPRTELRCFDGDPGCDIDGAVDGTCTFDIDVCLHNADPALPACTPAPVTGVTFQGTDDPDLAAAQAAVTALLPASTNVCTTGQALHVALPHGDDGTLRSATKQVQLSATTDGGGTDADGLTVTCVPHGWPSHGYDYANRRASPLETVLSPDNAASLTIKWRFDARAVSASESLNAVSSTPTVGFGLVFVTSWNGTIYALRESNGELVWSHKLTTQFPLGIQSTATLTADGRVLFGDADATVHCLDALTGRVLWERPLSIPFENEPGTDHIWGGVTIANNRVFVGIASHADLPCTRGRFAALDLDTGEVLWDIATVPFSVCDNDTGKTCTSNDECDGGTCVRGRGAGVTATPAVDASGETVYMNTVGCYTFPSIGDSDAIFRLDAATGNIEWKNRVVPPEQFSACADTGAECRSDDECGGAACSKKSFYHDFGFLNGPMVIQADDGMGGTRPLIVSGSKHGTLYAFNPDDGSIVWSNAVAPIPVTPGFAAYGLFNGAIGFADQRIYAALNSMASSTGDPPNHLRAFASQDGHEIWHDEIGRSWSHVAIANNLLLAGTQTVMPLCSTDLATSCTQDAQCPGGHCLQASPYFFYDARDGRRLKTITMPADVAGGPSIVDGSVYIPYGSFDIEGGIVAYALPACLGDCDRNGRVTVSELVTGVNIALSAQPIDRCWAFDRNANRSVQIDELVGGTNSALHGCSDAAATAAQGG